MQAKTLLALALGALVLGTGCSRNTRDSAKSDTEQAGEKVEDTAEKAGDKIEDTAEEAGDKVEDATDN
ncbi:YtxH domain-containing protein [Pyxidicoccus sp. 3LFB2]